jgi:hypothetical protein
MSKGLDIEAFKKALDEDLANPNGYWNKLKRKDEIKASRFPKVEAYIQKHGMPSVIERMISEHDDKWSDKCWKNGCETYPNNKFGILWDWVEKTHESVHNPTIPQDFLGASYFVKGYWFAIYCGQGCFYRVYDNDMNIILQI